MHGILRRQLGIADAAVEIAAPRRRLAPNTCRLEWQARSPSSVTFIPSDSAS
jgi:hypothetical protein